MRATIIVVDNIVLLDGQPQTVDCSELITDGVHAVQWYGAQGETEFATTFDNVSMTYNRKPNELFTDFTPYQKYIAAWEVARLDAIAKQAEQDRLNAIIAAEAKVKYETELREFIRKVIREEFEERRG
jgi:hypothetical protein